MTAHPNVAQRLEECVQKIATQVHNHLRHETTSRAANSASTDGAAAVPSPNTPKRTNNKKKKNAAVTALVVHKDAAKVLDYLTAEDGKHLELLAAAIQKGIACVFQDGRITVGDVPSILIMVKSIVQEVNAIHSKRKAAVKLAAETIIPLLRAVVCIVAELFLPAVECDMCMVIVNTAFSLLEMHVLPALQQRMFQCCFADTTAAP